MQQLHWMDQSREGRNTALAWTSDIPATLDGRSNEGEPCLRRIHWMDQGREEELAGLKQLDAAATLDEPRRRE